MNRRDLEALCRLSHEEVVLEPTDYTAPAGTVFHGHGGIESFIRGALERFPDLEVRPVESRQLETAVMVLVKIVREPETDPDGVDRVLLWELEDGLVRRASGFLTESEALEKAARSAHDGFHAVFDTAVEPMLLVDDNGLITDANRSAIALLELEPAEVGRRHVGDFVAAGSWTKSAGAIEIVSTTGRRSEMGFWATPNYRPGRHLVLLREPAALPKPDPSLLTAREREIFELLAQGLTAPQIADQLVLSPATVRTHVQNAVGKLGSATRVQAIANAIALGEITVDREKVLPERP